MPNAITTTSPLLYLYRIGLLNWLPQLFDEIWIPEAVVYELKAGLQAGFDVPIPENYDWLKIINPQNIPAEWPPLDLGEGDQAVLALARENTDRVVILDDFLARLAAQTVGLTVWGTLGVLLEAKKQGLADSVAPAIDNLAIAGMWITEEIRRRLLQLAGEG